MGFDEFFYFVFGVFEGSMLGMNVNLGEVVFRKDCFLILIFFY